MVPAATLQKIHTFGSGVLCVVWNCGHLCGPESRCRPMSKQSLRILIESARSADRSRDAQSKITLGVSKYDEGDYPRARELFEAAVEADFECAEGWVGKALVDAVSRKFEDGDNYLALVQSSLDHAAASPQAAPLLEKIRPVVVELLLTSLTNELAVTIEFVRTSDDEAKAARGRAILSGIAGSTAIGLAGQAKTTTGKVVGYGAGAVGLAYAGSQWGEVEDLANMATSGAGMLLAQVLVAAPFVGGIERAAPSATATVAVSKWKAVVAEFLNLQISRIPLKELCRQIYGAKAVTGPRAFSKEFIAILMELETLKKALDAVGLEAHPASVQVNEFLALLRDDALQADMTKLRRIFITIYVLGWTVAGTWPFYGLPVESGQAVGGVALMIVIYTAFARATGMTRFFIKTKRHAGICAVTKRLKASLEAAKIEPSSIAVARSP